MIIIDENFPESQRQLLLSWRINIRQIGIEVGREGLQDDEIISLLIKYKNPTFFSLDLDFYNRKLCHTKYCLAFLDLGQYESAIFMRRFLRNKNFDSQKKRMGKVIKVSHSGLLVWNINAEIPQKITGK
jgi:hypothetical protein